MILKIIYRNFDKTGLGKFDGNAMRLWWNWQIDRDLYPEWDNLTAELRRNGVRTMTYIDPMLHNILRIALK